MHARLVAKAWVVAVGVGLALVLDPGVNAFAQFRPAGAEFHVNSASAGNQKRPDIAGSPTTGFVVVWHGDSDGDGAGVFMRGFDGLGSALGVEQQVNSYTTSDQSFASISQDTAGNRVVVWTSSGEDGDGTGVYAQRFDSSGASLGAEFRVNSYTTGGQSFAHVAHDGSGDFIVVWSGPGTGDGDGGVYARRFDSLGASIGSEFLINTYTTGSQEDPEVSTDAAGEFVVVWTSADGQDGDAQGVYAQRFDAGAAPVGGEFQVAEITTVGQFLPSVAHSAGRFMVGWRNDWIFEHVLQRVSVRVYDGVSGSALSGEIGAIDTVFERLPQLASAPNLGFLVVESETGLRMNPFGFRVGTEFPSNDDAVAGAAFTRAILDDNGDFVLAWESRDAADPASNDIVARRFCSDGSTACDVCVGFDDSIDDDGDGIPNGCDPCNNVGGALNAVKAKLSMADGSGQIGVAAKKSRLKIRGDVDLASAFVVLDPLSQGAFVRVENAKGQRVVEAALPSGAFAGSNSAGWKTNASGSKWVYVDRRADSPSGIIKAVFKDRSAKAPGRVSVTVKGRGAAYKVDEPLPYKTIVRFGNAGAGAGGLCGESAFSAGGCALTPKPVGGVLRCK